MCSTVSDVAVIFTLPKAVLLFQVKMLLQKGKKKKIDGNNTKCQYFPQGIGVQV